MPVDRQDASGRAGFFRRHALGIGIVLYSVAAATDMYMTLQGIGGDLAMEGNPIMRAMMRRLGPELGLLTEKVAVGCITGLIALRGERAIRDGAAWIRKVPSTRWARDWMQRKDRSWVAFIPLYTAAAGQGLATVSWALLDALR